MKKWVWVGAAVVVLVFVLFGVGLFGKPSDEQQIHDALTRAIKASKEGRPGGVLEYLSQGFQVNNTKFNAGAIANQIKESKPDVEVSSTTPTILGDSALIESPVTLSLTLPPLNVKLAKVKIEFQREDTRRMLIFPAKDWKMTKITIPEETFNDLSSQFGGDFSFPTGGLKGLMNN